MTGPAPFHGTTRFEIRRRIGEGAVGIVYEAFDREYAAPVALKVLRTVSPEMLLLLKNEFRIVQDLAHPNLVRLGELLEASGSWFFTMELVRGSPFSEYVGRGSFDERKLRNSLAQLAAGLCALHAANKVHRDVKPSNVLVTRAGRVVILDFGVTSDIVNDDGAQGLVGTAGYMAPEQVELAPIGPAADWYSVGVVLYEVLTGRLPFVGTIEEVFMQKLNAEPAPPRALAPDVPEDLDDLCTELLRLDPAARPSGETVARRLGAAEPGQTPASAKHHDLALIGRNQELRELERAFEQTRESDGGIAVLVFGESGVGKSFLVRKFLQDLTAKKPEVLVLSGRCYERESVPYKAFDDIIDKLTRFLVSLDEEIVSELVPRGAALLVRAFPVFENVRSVLPDSSRGDDVLNPHEMRARVFATIRELLVRLSRRRPLVIAIDDLQWADSDSLALLGEVMRPPKEPPLLLIATVRSSSDTPRAGASPAAQIPGTLRQIHLHGLPAEDACRLAEQFLEDVGCEFVAREQIETLIEDAKGHPLFIDEILRQRALGQTDAVGRLDDALWNRIARLPPAATRLLELLAVAGTPLILETAANAAAIDLAQLFELATSLRVGALVRTTGPLRADEIEPYHDRISESVLLHLDPRTRELWHGRLAVALEHEPGADPEAIAAHWQAAGDAQHAARYFERAAEQAQGTLAFDRAARLFQMALDACPHAPDRARMLKRRLAEAFTNAGQVATAAELRLELARDAPPEEAFELRRRAAEQLLYSGHFERGTQLVREVLRAAGLYYPRSPWAIIISLVFVRFLLLLRGMKFRPRDRDGIHPRLIMRVDAAASASAGFAMSDNIRGAYFQTRHVLAALRAGEPSRVVRGLAVEACFLAAGGSRTYKRTRKLLELAKELAERVGTPEALALASAATGWMHFFMGQWQQSSAALAHAEELFRDQCVGVTFHLNSTRTLLHRALYSLGDLPEVRRRVQPVLRDAEQQNDLYTMITCKAGLLSMLALADDRPDEAEEILRDVSKHLTNDVFLVHHYFAMLAESQLALYRGDPLRAYECVVSAWPKLERSLLMRVQSIAIFSIEQRARSAIALACVRPEQAEKLLRSAECDALRLERLGYRWPELLSHVVRAGVAAAHGNPLRAGLELARAREGFDEIHMKLHAAAALRMQGLLMGESEGAALVEESHVRFAMRGVVKPARMTAMIVPIAS
ncbi:MAG TPA: protein kinase [Polyangiaceae bacterium]